MKNNKQFWVPGIPAPFATKREVPWKIELERSIPAPPIEKFNGLKLKFVLPALAPNNQPLDIDNLCEPVFSVLINKLGWFGSRRPNLKWWRASKICGQPSGLQLSLMEQTVAPEMTEEYGSPFFDITYQGVLPSKATAPQIPSWLHSLKKFETPQNNDRFIICLQFRGLKVNIGDIATGKVKAIIDCLYPVIGGSGGKPEDWRADIVQVEKDAANFKNESVRIRIWRKGDGDCV